jgi:hypothetical protein
MPVSLEGRKREVLQLLRDYRDWHSAYGAAGEMNFESRGQYGPAGMIFKGMAFDAKHRHMLEDSFYLLEQALTLLKYEEMHLWLLLLSPYLGDPGDPSLVDVWRKKKPRLAEHHDLAITKLAEYLQHQDLYVAWPDRMKSRRPATVKERNDEFYMAYQQERKEGETKRKAIQIAAEWCGYSEYRGYEIIRVREGGEPRKRKKV